MKKKINQKKYKRKICFDLDGVICRTEKNFYQKSKPIINSINKINQLYDNRNYILIYSARFMGRSKERISLAKNDLRHSHEFQHVIINTDFHQTLKKIKDIIR